MALLKIATTDESGNARVMPDAYANHVRSDASAVSWGAILAGAAGAAALSLILLMLGIGLGLSVASPWKQDGISAAAFGMSTILWVTLTQLIASGMGGYLAGRLRTKWTAVHTDEVFFRDTAHGFLAWAVASLATAALLTSAIGSIVSVGTQAGATVAAGVASGAAAGTSVDARSDNGPTGYLLDSLFRRDANATSTVTDSGPVASASIEVARIFANAAQLGALPPEDVKYAGQMVAQRTGITQQEAEKRVNDTYARMQIKVQDVAAAADKGRKASAYAALWLFISLLIGAFVASLGATYGGRQRDA